MEELKTRKDEVVIKTNDITKLAGMYTRERVVRKWKEDVVDGNDVVTIERTEHVMGKGELLDKEALAKISFYLQSGDIEEVEASNQQRKGQEVEYYRRWPWLVRYTIGAKTKEAWLCKTAGGAMAVLQAAKDFMELKVDDVFSINQVAAMNDGIIIETEEPTEEERCSAMNEGEPIPEWTWWKLELRVDMVPVVEADDAHSTVTYATYIVKQATIEAALIEVENYMQELETKRRVKEPTAPVRECVIAIQKAAPIKINGIIPEQFAAAYVEE